MRTRIVPWLAGTFLPLRPLPSGSLQTGLGWFGQKCFDLICEVLPVQRVRRSLHLALGERCGGTEDR